MAISLTTQIPYRPIFQAAIAPVKMIYSLFLRAIGYLLHCFGAIEWGKTLRKHADWYDASSFGVLTGLWAYGMRFMVASNNYQRSCRGSCYWFIDQMFSHPEKSLIEIASAFENGAPKVAVKMHKEHLMPKGFKEEKIWTEETVKKWPRMPNLDPGVYTFLVGYSKKTNDPKDAHRFVIIKEKQGSVLFDPNTGLSKWLPSDWEPLLERLGSMMRTGKAGYFTIECYRYTR